MKSISQKDKQMKIQLFIENPIQTNCWAVIDEESKEAIIIDLGGGYHKIKSYIEQQGATLKAILCTHGHFDHIMGIPLMQEGNNNIPVLMNEKDKLFAENINDMLQLFGFQEQYPPVKITQYIDENSELYLGKHKIQVIETPGHTQGGVCFKIDNLLFSGDTLFAGEVGRCDLPGGNFNALINSLKTKLAPLDDDTLVYPGHGPSTTLKAEKLHNPYFK